MTTFKAFLQIINRNKVILIIYSVILVTFSAFSLKSNETSANFEATRPDVYIVNHDSEEGITRSLVDYLKAHCEVVSLGETGEATAEQIDDALFYRQVNYVLEIPAGFHENFWRQGEAAPVLEYQSTGDYNASLAENYVNRFLSLAAAYPEAGKDPAVLVQFEKVLSANVPVELTAKVDTNAMSQAAFYYNFLNYPLIAGCVFMICLTLLSFRERKIAQRINVSSTDPRQLNRELLLANSLFAVVLWLVYVVLSFVVVGGAMFSLQGLWLILNSAVFMLCVTALAFFLANIVHSRDSINGLVNVIGLGSSFLCGAFVPLRWLPDSVRAIAHVLPSYWYIDANEQIAALEEFSWENLCPILLCMGAVLIFAIMFVVLTNVVTRTRRK